MSIQTVDCAAERSPLDLAVKASPNFRTIHVKSGPDARCDEQDYAFLSRFSWQLHNCGGILYPATKMGTHIFPMHQMVLQIFKGKIRHCDGDTFNNGRGNLRPESNCGWPDLQPSAARVLKGQELSQTSSESQRGRIEAHIPAIRTISVADGPDAQCDEEDFCVLSRFKWRLSQAGRLCYPLTRVGRRNFYMHQIVLQIYNRKINHRDGNIFNNCRANLHVLSNIEIQASKGKMTARTCSSQYKGVCRRKGASRWFAAIGINGTRVELGSFDSEEAAARCYDQAAFERLGKLAYLNFPGTNLSAGKPGSSPASE